MTSECSVHSGVDVGAAVKLKARPPPAQSMTGLFGEEEPAILIEEDTDTPSALQPKGVGE